ncbi:hypothetical protein [Klebsiella pneumoniae IS33]|nr:hypothetical protein [Klebsiella pneumoniae IS33]
MKEETQKTTLAGGFFVYYHLIYKEIFTLIWLTYIDQPL